MELSKVVYYGSMFIEIISNANFFLFLKIKNEMKKIKNKNKIKKYFPYLFFRFSFLILLTHKALV